MGRRIRPALRGLDALGARLKRIRQQAGLSQMKLARLIGFDPAHGYKYVLRLEKGQVPNPTLRTIAACLEACGAGWQSVADVLPATGDLITAGAAQAPTGQDGKPTLSPPAPGSEPPTATAQSTSPSSAPAPPAASAPRLPKDSRPLRERLRLQRIQGRELRTQRFWSSVKLCEEAVRSLLHSLPGSSRLQHAYLSFARSCCSTIDAYEDTRPEAVERELAKLIPPTVEKGLDRRLLLRIQSACLEVFRSQTQTG